MTMNFIVITTVVIGVIKLASAQDTKKVELSGNDVICPGDKSFIECKVIHSEQLSWTIGTRPLGIFGTGNTKPRSLNISSGRYVAMISGGAQGNLTSILCYEIAPNFTDNVTITCSNELDIKSSKTVIGNNEIDRPTYSMNSTSDKTVTHFWNHPSKGMVTGYKVTVKSDEGHQEMTLDTPSVTIPRIPNTVYNISVCAVGRCGAESLPLEFTGSEDPVDYCICKNLASAANKVYYGTLPLMTFYTLILIAISATDDFLYIINH